MATHSSTLAWKIPWTEEPGRLQSMGSLWVGHDWATSLSCNGEGNGNPLQCSCLENPRDRGAWWAAIYGVTQNWTWLKRLSSSSRVPIKSEYCLESIFIHLILLCPWRGFSGWNIMMSLLLYAWGHSKIVELAQGHPVTDLVSSWIQSFVSECLLILLDHNYFWTWGPEFHQ